MDLFRQSDVKREEPTNEGWVIRYHLDRIYNGYKPGWLYYRCKDKGFLESYEKLKSNGFLHLLEFGAEQSNNSKPRLTIELVPRSCWFDNVRSQVSKNDWDILRKRSARLAGYKCEICGGKGPKWPVECHEVWRYDEEVGAQVLERLTSLCPACHEVKHIGFAELKDRRIDVTAHLAIVNGWSYQ